MADNLHDSFFRESFAKPELVAELLANYLPPELVAEIDLSRLEVLKETFVDEEFRRHLSDLLCRAPLLVGGHIFIYFLIEHKSWPARFVALQLLRYMVRIWEQTPETAGAKLPVIFPLVIYHGKRAWRVPREFGALFDTRALALVPGLVPDYRYFLLDFSPAGETPVKGEQQLEALLLTLRGVFDDGTLDWLARVIRLSLNEPGRWELLIKIFDYVVKAGRTNKQEVDQVLQQIEKADRRAKRVRRGYLEGWFDEGRAEGIVEGAALLLTQQLTQRFGPLGKRLPQRLKRLSLPQIEQLGRAIFELQSRKDVLTWLKQQGV